MALRLERISELDLRKPPPHILEDDITLGMLLRAQERIRNKKMDWWGFDDKHWQRSMGNRLCAIQALQNEIKFYIRHGATEYPRNEPIQIAKGLIHDAAQKLYGRYRIENVNDYIGHEAVMRCYDYAINKRKGQLLDEYCALRKKQNEAILLIGREEDLAVAGD